MRLLQFAEYGLGREAAVDPKDAAYPMRALTVSAKQAGLKPRVRPWRRGPILNQGNTSRCVEYATAAWLNAAPVMHFDALQRLHAMPDGRGLYEWAQERDEWPGEDYDGTSARGAMKAALEVGIIQDGYNWATTFDQVTAFVKTVAPVMLGTDWTLPMFTPDSKGFVDPIGGSAGGHEYLMLWYYEQRDVCLFQNSWGESWGDKGLFRMRGGAVRELLEDRGGDAVVPAEVKRLWKPSKPIVGL